MAGFGDFPEITRKPGESATLAPISMLPTRETSPQCCPRSKLTSVSTLPGFVHPASLPPNPAMQDAVTGGDRL